MKRTIIALFAALLAAFPIVALADSMKIGNITGKTLHFSVRCDDGTDGWHNFTLGSLDTKTVASGDWNYSCDAERYQLRIGTTLSDGSVQYQIVKLKPGKEYALVQSREKNGYTAYNTRWMVGMRNDTSVAVHVSYSCIQGPAASGQATVTPVSQSGTPGWFYSKGCSRYNVATSVRQSDGSLSEWSKDISANNNYRIVWSSSRHVYMLEQL